MAKTDPLSPEASPGGPNEKNGKLITGVRRVNNLPVYIVIGCVALFLFVVMLIVINKSKPTVEASELASKQSESSVDMANKVAGAAPAGGEVAAIGAAPIPPVEPTVVPGPTAYDENGVPIAPVNPDMPPVPPGGSAGNYSPPPVNPEVAFRRQRQDAMRQAKDQMFTDAVRAPTNIKMAAARSAGSPGGQGGDDSSARLDALRQQIAANAAQGNAPSASDLQTLAMLQGQGNGGGAGGAGGAAGGQAQRNTNDIGQFGNRAGGDRWQSQYTPQAPRSRYELRAGFVIPGTLISGINSELPGQIVAQVSQNVFDTPTGKYLIIPQGSRLVGEYSSQVEYGQSRVLIAWQRIIFPDGKAMDIGAMPGSDSAGYAGFKDKVNNHYLRIFGSALIMSGVTAGATLSQPQSNFNNNNGRQNASGALSEALGQQLGQATAMLIQKNLTIAPTLTIRPGYRFNVVVLKDLTFSKPYRAFDY